MRFFLEIRLRSFLQDHPKPTDRPQTKFPNVLRWGGWFLCCSCAKGGWSFLLVVNQRVVFANELK